MVEMTEEAREKKNEYLREWRKRNPDRVREMTRRYWEKKVKSEEMRSFEGK